MIPFRHPDRLFHIFSLTNIREGEYLSQTKYDGHYAVIIKDDNKIKVLSRHDKTLAVSPKMIASLETIGLNNGDVLHGEWTSRRESNKVESMYLFNQVFMGYEWLGAIAEEERFKRLREFKMNEDVLLVENREGGYAAHYKSTINDWKTEGIVLKLKKGKYFGDLRTPKDNPGYFKLKWREGSDGRSIRIVPDDKLTTRP